MVEGVNNNRSNAGLYATSGALIGAAGVVGTAYLTKPYLKGEGLTKEGISIVKKAVRNIQGKYAMIYGGIAAAVLGVVGLVAGAMSTGKTDEVAQKPAPNSTEA